MNKLEEGLQNFPKRNGDTFERLQTIVDERLQTTLIKPYEQARLERELSVIKETDTACVFLFFYDTVQALKDVNAVLYGVCHCSYLLYFLGVIKVNPLEYRLPFERYFNKKRKLLPMMSIAVQKGKKGKVIKYLKEQYGADKIARIKDEENEYVLSAQSLLDLGEIEKTVLHTDENENDVWHEDVSSLTSREISRLNLYTFTVEEADMGEYRRFSEEEIYQKMRDCFTNEFRDFNKTQRYQGIKEVEKIFSATDGKFIYQEQFLEICMQVLGINGTDADECRKCICKRKRQEIERIRALFSWKLGEDGKRLFDYLNDRIMFTISKAFIIGLLFLDFEKKR